mgnify:CR=1 FL=1
MFHMVEEVKTLSTLFWILIVVAALIGGIAIGFFIARKYMMNYLEQNPPINEDMIRTLMMQMGQKPSQKKVNQVMRAMNVQMKNEKKS